MPITLSQLAERYRDQADRTFRSLKSGVNNLDTWEKPGNLQTALNRPFDRIDDAQTTLSTNVIGYAYRSLILYNRIKGKAKTTATEARLQARSLESAESDISRIGRDGIHINHESIHKGKTFDEESPLDRVPPIYSLYNQEKIDITDFNEVGPEPHTIQLLDLDFEGFFSDSSGAAGKRASGIMSDTLAALIIPFTPREVSVDPKSDFVTLSGIGQNVKDYHFTGAEKIISFTIDWHRMSEIDEPIVYAEWLESLSMSDGYNKLPHKLRLIWGNDPALFVDDVWLITKASYKMSNFNGKYLTPHGSDPNVYHMKDGRLLPRNIIQEVELKRIGKTNPQGEFSDSSLTYIQNLSALQNVRYD